MEQATMEQNSDLMPQRGVEQEWGGMPGEYKQYLPLGALAGTAGLGLAIAKLLENRRRRRRSFRYRAVEYLREHSGGMGKDLEKRTRSMRKQIRRQARSTNKTLQKRAGYGMYRLRKSNYDRLRKQTAEQLSQLPALLAAYGGVLAASSQRTAKAVAHRAQDLASETPEMVQRVGDLAQDLTATLKEAMQSTASGISERAQAIASTGPAALRQAGGVTSERAQQMASTVQERISATTKEARRKSKRGRTGLRALILGVATGILVAPWRGEEIRHTVRHNVEKLLKTVLRPAQEAPEAARAQQQYDPAI